MAKEQEGWQARKLLRQCRAATLATASGGQPFAGWVTPATTATGAVILLLSELSEHTRQLHAEPRCALLVVGEAVGANPQTTPRVSITGTAAPVAGGAANAPLMARYLAVHPYAARYAGFTDFRLWQFNSAGALLVGGFAQATRLTAAELLPDPGNALRVAAEAGALGAPAWVERIAARAGLGAAALAGIDQDGVDLALDLAGEGARSVRLSFDQPVLRGQSLTECLAAWAK